jgi:opacity protein-like surface antigen
MYYLFHHLQQEGRMKKLALVLALAVLLLAIPGAAFAQNPDWVGLVHQGDFAAYLGLGLGYGFSLVPGVEWAFADVRFGDTVPVAFGVTAKGILNFYPGFWTSYGIGALATAHLGLKGLDIPEFLQNLDFYISAGIGFSAFSYDAGSTMNFGDTKLGFATADGVAYYINDKWAIYLEGSYWAYSAAASLGARYTF